MDDDGMEDELIDYSEAFPDALMAEGKGSNVLLLHLLHTPRRNAAGQICRYELEYRWLSQECRTDRDQAWACVQGSEVTLWPKRGVDLKRGLFEQFRLWG